MSWAKPPQMPAPPKRAMQVNDIVRLVRGWTPMTISYIYPNGDILAFYGIQDFDPAGERNPCISTSGYTRPRSGFVWWDGDFIPERNLPMARRFNINNLSSMVVGILTGFTSNGLYILELADGSIQAYAEDEITEIKPFSFAVRYPTGATSTFSFEDPGKRVQVNDILLDLNSLLLCTVTAIDTGANRPKNFRGLRVKTEEIT